MKQIAIFLPFIIPLLMTLGGYGAIITGHVGFPTIENTYCTGWDEGYPEGYKDVKGKYAIVPVTPLCPIPEIDKDTYKDGYNRAFKQGVKDAKEK